MSGSILPGQWPAHGQVRSFMHAILLARPGGKSKRWVRSASALCASMGEQAWQTFDILEA